MKFLGKRGAALFQIMIIGGVLAGAVSYYSNRVVSVGKIIVRNRKSSSYQFLMRGILSYAKYVLQQRFHIDPNTGLIDNTSPESMLITDQHSLERLLLKDLVSNDFYTKYNGKIQEITDFFNSNDRLGLESYSFTVSKTEINTTHPLYVVFNSNSGKSAQKVKITYKSNLESTTSEVLIDIVAELYNNQNDLLSQATSKVLYYPRPINQFVLTTSRNLVLTPDDIGAGDGLVQEQKFNTFKNSKFLSPVFVNGDLVVPDTMKSLNVTFNDALLISGDLLKGNDLNANTFDVTETSEGYIANYKNFKGIKRGVYRVNYEQGLENIFAHNSKAVDTSAMQKCIDYQNRKYDVSKTNGSIPLIRKAGSDYYVGLTKENEFVNVTYQSNIGKVLLDLNGSREQLSTDDTDYKQIHMADAGVIVPANGVTIEKIQDGEWKEKVVTPAVTCGANDSNCTPQPEQVEYVVIDQPYFKARIIEDTSYSKSVMKVRFAIDTFDSNKWKFPTGNNGSFELLPHTFLTNPETGVDTTVSGVTTPKAAATLKFSQNGVVLYSNNQTIESTWKKYGGGNYNFADVNEENQLNASPSFFDYGVCDGTTVANTGSGNINSYDTSYVDSSFTSWNYNPVTQSGQFVPSVSATGGAYLPLYSAASTTIANRIKLDNTNQDLFHSRSIVDRCTVTPSAQKVMGFFVCRVLVILPRTTSLKMIGSFIVDKLVNQSSKDVTWMNIFHPDARVDLETDASILPESSPDCKVSYTKPIWSKEGVGVSEKCDTSIFLQKADPFRWTSFDPLCGLNENNMTQTTCKPRSRVLNYWFTTLSEKTKL